MDARSAVFAQVRGYAGPLEQRSRSALAGNPGSYLTYSHASRGRCRPIMASPQSLANTGSPDDRLQAMCDEAAWDWQPVPEEGIPSPREAMASILAAADAHDAENDVWRIDGDVLRALADLTKLVEQYDSRGFLAQSAHHILADLADAPWRQR